MSSVGTDDAAVVGTGPRARAGLLLRWFSSAPDAARYRRPTDVVLLAASVLGLVVLALAAPGPTDADTAIVGLVRAVPGLYGWWWEVSYVLLPLWAVVVLLAVARGRVRVLADLLLAAVVGLLLAVGCGRLAGTKVGDSLAAVVHTGPPATYVGVLVAMCTAVIVTASPHLARPVRNLGRLILLLAALGGVGLGVAWPIGMLAGVLVGTAGAALVHLALGSPDGEVTADRVAEALEELGVPAGGVRRAARQSPGACDFDADGEDGTPLRVRVYGRDARDSEVLMSLWRSLWVRGERAHLGRGRLELVEHEAVLSLLAARGGVDVPAVLAVGQSVDGDALLVTSGAGRAWEDVAADDLTDAVLAQAWHQLQQLHSLGLAHGAVDDRHLRLGEDGAVMLVGLGRADVSGSGLTPGTDQARLLTTTALCVGDERAVTAAFRALGTDGLAAVLPYLQPAALDRRTRARVRAGEWDLQALSTRVVGLVGVEPPPLQRLRRLRWRDVLVGVGGALLGWLVVSRLAGVDWSSLWAELSSASWGWLAAALVASPLVGAALAFATLGASVRPLRYGPTVMLQWAIGFMAVVLPSTAARLALDVRYFQRFGIAAGAALSIGLIDSVSGFVVQVLLLLLVVLSPVPGLTSPVDATGGSSDTGSHVVAVVTLVVVALVVVGALLLPRVRRRVAATWSRLRTAAREQVAPVREAMTVLRRPAKVAEMLCGNLGAQLVQAAILALCLHAYGGSAHFGQLILVNTLVALFGGLMPVPGGVGVCEVALTAGLQAVGVPSAVALSSAVSFRLVTFYLPPLWGSAAMAWLRRRQYV